MTKKRGWSSFVCVDTYRWNTIAGFEKKKKDLD